MKRINISPRDNWQKLVESKGLTFHSREGVYWNESACYEFSSKEVDVLEAAANEVHERCLEACQYVIDKNLFSRMKIPDSAVRMITDSWNNDQLHLYGRFDFLYDGKSAPKVLEYNADTPTSLLEAAVIQWYWLQDKFPGKDQFNSLHEKLIARWKELSQREGIKDCHFSALEDTEEDIMTVSYLQDCADQAGIKTKYLDIGKIGFHKESRTFVDMEGNDITNMFKLYPWEWMVNEEFGTHIRAAGTRFIEPAWKMIWSNKAILPILWEMFPNHPNILPCYETQDKLNGGFVKKPFFGREGANVTIDDHGKKVETGGEYGENGFVYQEYCKTEPQDGKYPVLGVWMIGDEASGMGIRESDSPITDNKSRFTPHYFS